MIQIDKIEVYYFRSIYKLSIAGLKDLALLSGKNDSGKSNVLKALNLFFNNQTDWKTTIQFTEDFNKDRLNEVRKETIKGKQFIRVRVQFIRGNKFIKSLPDKFSVTKTWYRNSSTPEIKTTIEKQFSDGKIQSESLHRSVAQLQNYLNKIKYEYVPAVKDREFFLYSLGLLQDTILETRTDDGVERAVKNLNTTVEVGTRILNEEFMSVCGVETDIKLPPDLASLFRAFSIATKSGNDEVPLTKRGDGIQTRFIPSLLYHVSRNSKNTYIWGFEEPENCLEHSLASDLASDMQNYYCKETQIIITSHSPAFLSLSGSDVIKYRVYKDANRSQLIEIYPKLKKPSGEHDLKDELGLLKLIDVQQKEYLDKKKRLEEEERSVKELKEKYQESTRPILLTEGKTDPLILEAAWNALYAEDTPFRILSCNTLPEEEGEAAGASMLKTALNSSRPDQPITIGLFDYDDEGIKEYKRLNANFINSQANIKAKIHKNNICAAFCIPKIDGKEEYYKANNLPIEFVFEEEYLSKTNKEGRGLVLENEKAVTLIKGVKVKEEESTEPHFRKIAGGKATFASDIVKLFDAKAFSGFSLIFEAIKELLELLGHNN